MQKVLFWATIEIWEIVPIADQEQVWTDNTEEIISPKPACPPLFNLNVFIVYIATINIIFISSICQNIFSNLPTTAKW